MGVIDLRISNMNLCIIIIPINAKIHKILFLLTYILHYHNPLKALSKRQSYASNLRHHPCF